MRWRVLRFQVTFLFEQVKGCVRRRAEGQDEASRPGMNLEPRLGFQLCDFA
jgi:hypothetical protein